MVDVSYINASKGRKASLKCNRKARNNFSPCFAFHALPSSLTSKRNATREETFPA